MKHLTDEERLAFVEGHANAETQKHAAECADCAREIESCRRTIQRLENFDWPAPMRRRATASAPLLKWAIAAGIVLCVGFGLGRLAGPNAAQIEASVKDSVSRDLQQQLVALNAQKKPEVDPVAILALLTELREQQTANYVSLRKDLETLASTADARLQSNSRQILQLAETTRAFSDPIQ